MTHQHKHFFRPLLSVGAVMVCFLLLLPLFRILPVGAQTQPVTDTNRDEFDDRITAFFDALRTSRVNSASALNELLRGSPLGAPEADGAVDALRSRVDELREQFGTIHTYERLDARRIGTSITIVRFVLMYERYPVVWTFTFYRKPSTTPSVTGSLPNPAVLIQLHFDTDIKSLQ